MARSTQSKAKINQTLGMVIPAPDEDAR